ncbi:catalase family peroxidase [Pinibacter soli]|uniref:Catalase-related peroxidase n=1 Tax=Pinibacter soli TaxID=3044211 RepID=A0ABT6REC4_9BACT|nr:catalase family peroxidase [Pinibacter soli]MDI3320878.1 catalase family peroxidase [Pinibacter soli]
MKQVQLTLLLVISGALSSGIAYAQHDTLKYDPKDLVTALHTTFGEHHARAVHTKGLFFDGTFSPSKDAAAITKAKHLQNKSSNVIVRFSDFTGIPDIPDNAGPANPRGMAIKFIMDDSSATDIVGHSFNGFPTENSDQFHDLLLSIARSGEGALKPTALDSFLATHPIAKTFLTTQKLPASYATIAYFGVNAFKFTNRKGKSCYIRYQFIPEEEKLLTAQEYNNKDADYLINEIKNRIAKKPVVFKMYAQIAENIDVIDNPSVAWPNTRRKVFLGTVTLTRLADNSEAADKALFFIPNNIPAGIEPADPMIDFRSKAYPISVKERQ